MLPAVQPNLPGADTERWLRSPASWAAEIHGGGHGTVSIGRASSTGGVYQRRYRAEEARSRLGAGGREDVYMSMARFGPGLGTANLTSLSALYADLDYYNRPDLVGQHPYMVAEAAIHHLQQKGIPAPTHTIASGRGVYLIWSFAPVRPDALPRWRAAAREIAEALRDFGADRAASTDAARILRVPGSVHGGTGATVEPLMPAGEVYDFGPLCDAILPVTRAQLYDLRRERQLRRGGRGVATSRPGNAPEGYGSESLAAARMRDLERLRDLRGSNLGNDCRSRYLQIAAATAVYAEPSPERARERLHALAAEVAGWSPRQTDSRLGTTFRRAEGFAGRG